MQKLKKIGVSGFNTFLLGIIISGGSWASREAYKELRSIHDGQLRLEQKELVQDQQIKELKGTVSRHDTRLQKLESKKL